MKTSSALYVCIRSQSLESSMNAFFGTAFLECVFRQQKPMKCVFRHSKISRKHYKYSTQDNFLKKKDLLRFLVAKGSL